MRRGASRGDPQPEQAPASPRPGAPATALKARIAHLEKQVQGLQDSIHRESMREERQLAELESRIEPGAMAAALSADARERRL
jgi:hypothetical protein